MKARTWWRRARSLQHVLRTTLGAVVALATAGLLTLPEPYWAPITTMVVMQSSLESTYAMAARRLVGTLLGAVLGALLYHGNGIGATRPIAPV